MRTSKVFQGIVVMCGQYSPVVSDRDFAAMSRRIASVGVEMRKNHAKIPNYAQSVLMKECLVFSILTLMMAGSLEADKKRSRPFIDDLIKRLNDYSTDLVLLSTVRQDRDPNPFLFDQVDPICVFSLQFENGTTEDISLPHYALLYIRYLVTRPGSKVLISDVDMYSQLFVDAFASKNKNAWKKVSQLVYSHVDRDGKNIKSVVADPGLASTLTKTNKRPLASIESSPWTNLDNLVRSRVEYLQFLGVDVAHYEKSRKLIESSEPYIDSDGQKKGEADYYDTVNLH